MWYNEDQVRWSRPMGVLLFNFTPGSGSNRDWAPEEVQQRLADVDILTFDCEIHDRCPTDGCNAAQLSSWPFGLST